MQEVEMIFFDAGGTLLTPRDDVADVYARAGRRQGLDVPPKALLVSFLEAFGRQKRHGRVQDRAWWREVVEGTFAPFGRPRDGEALLDELFDYFTSPASWCLDPDALDTVTTLRRRGYRTGLISNWDDRLPAILGALGLAPLLEPRVVSYAVGAEKPDSRIFRAALEEAGVAADLSLMVGDDPEADVRGAEAVGIQAVLLRRHPLIPTNGAPVIDRLDELLTLLPPR